MQQSFFFRQQRCLHLTLSYMRLQDLGDFVDSRTNLDAKERTLTAEYRPIDGFFCLAERRVQCKKLRLSSMSFNCTNGQGMWGYLGTCIMANREMEKGSFALSLTFANIRISGPGPIQKHEPRVDHRRRNRRLCGS